MHRPLCDGDPSWSSLFTALIWLIWKQMNDYVFKGVTYKTDSIIHSSYSWAKCYETNIRNPTARPRQQGATSTWSSPPRGWTCLNTDGVVATLDGRGSIGGVFRNSIGDWITGFTKNIGTTSTLHAELWSIYEGLLIARSLGVLRLLIQSDCNRAVKLVEDSAAIDSHIPLVRAILKQRRSGCCITKVQWISRNKNKIADKMAKLASWNHFSLIRFDSPLDELVDLLRLEAVNAQQDDATRHA
ncbi:hypothetical protein F3Y22_tig00112004pilonHSYRG00018 [Hibiscus syriacus]|uniref:RNase H type-1 domain-containing protein n=1 Tax=Hibiscus syriacus TaxID=106335 RepID=A0A6A2XMC3_HIBSY|nr:hypothetical protein F3Y22_tig00112004pilonHSYRG00018 [Hibiscus syriacus]